MSISPTGVVGIDFSKKVSPLPPTYPGKDSKKQDLGKNVAL
jgi:hypothetical protein